MLRSAADQPDEQRFADAVAAFFDAREAGLPANSEALFAAFPDRHDELRLLLAEFKADSQTRPGLSSSLVPLPPPPTSRMDAVAASPLQSMSKFVSRQIGDYELLDEVARGGMGVIYRARQRGLNRIVALKMILAGRLSGDEQVRRFRAEAQAAGRLQHPHIVAVHDVGEVDGQHFFTMDFVEGRSLSDLIRRDAPSAQQSARYVALVADAVQYAHARGIVHRDLKPSNIIVDTSDQPRITDFGLSRRLDVDSDLTATGQVLGTPSYMSPEQARGDQSLVGPSGDVYSLGAVLYELLCGRPPFRAETPVETLRQVVDSDPLAPRALNPSVSRDLETICLKCLQKEPAGRYASAGELSQDLQRFMDGRPIVARPIGAVARTWRWCRRKPALAAALGTTVIAAIIAVAVSVGYGVQQARFAEKERLHAGQLGLEKAATERALEQVEHQRGLAEKRGVELSRQLAESHFDAGQRLCEQGDVHRGLLQMTRALRFVPDEAGDLDRTVRVSLSAWFRHAVPVTRFDPTDGVPAAFSPNGRFVLLREPPDEFVFDVVERRAVGKRLPYWGGNAALVSADGRLVVEADYGTMVRVCHSQMGEAAGSPLDVSQHVVAMTLSPRGDVLLTSTPSGIQRWDTATLQPIGEIIMPTRAGGTDNAAPVSAVAFSQDGQTFAAAIGGGVQLFQTTTGTPIGPLSGGQQDMIQAVTFSRDGRFVITGALDRTVRLRYLEEFLVPGTAPYSHAPLNHLADVRHLLVSDDGRWMLARLGNGTTQLWDLPRGARAGPPLSPPTGSRAAFHPDGESIVLAEGRSLQVRRLPQDVAPVPVGPSIESQRTAFSTDGAAILACARQEGHLHHVDNGQRFGPALSHEFDIRVVDFNSDNRLILTADSGKILKIWTASPAPALLDSLQFERGIFAARFCPDAKTIAVSTGDEVRFWDTEQRVFDVRSIGSRTLALAIVPDGTMLVTANPFGDLEFRDLNSWERLATLRAHSQFVQSVAVSPDGTRIASGSPDGTARIVDARRRILIGPPLEHGTSVSLVQFSRDSMQLATVSENRVRLWDARTAKSVGPPLTHDGPVHGMFFTTDGNALLTESGTIRSWPLPRVLPGDAAYLQLWIEVATGLQLDARGDIHVLDLDAWNARRARLNEPGGPPMD